MDQPLVSVLMPVYNGEQFLRPAIESILGQTFRDFELIIVNDGSSDSSEAIVQSYNDSRIRYFRNEQNLKLIATLNKGLDLCNGKYIARMDSDDIAFPDRLTKQVEYMEAHPEVGLCGTQIKIDPPMTSWVRTGSLQHLRFCFLFHNPFCHPTVIIRNSIIKKYDLRYPSDYIHAEEYVFWMYILKYSSGVNLTEEYLFYRTHAGQVSAVHRKKQLETGEKIRRELLSEINIFRWKRLENVQAQLTNQWFAGEYPRYEEILVNVNNSHYFESWSHLIDLWLWIWTTRFSLWFRPRMRSHYTRSWIREVKKVAAYKTRQRRNKSKNSRP